MVAHLLVQLSADAALSWRKSAMLYRSKQKPLIDPMFSRRLSVGVLPGGQSGVGPTNFSTEEFSGDRVRRGADRGDSSSCAPRLFLDSARRDSGGRIHCDSRCRGRDGVRSAVLATVRRVRVTSVLADRLRLVFAEHRRACFRFELQLFVFDRDRNTRNIASAEPRQPGLGFGTWMMDAQDLD